VHGFFESGDPDGGAGFVEDWLKGYGRAGHLHCHLSWHLALFELARGNAERAQAIYLDNIRPSVAFAAPMLVLADTASFLWRWRFYDAAPPLDQEWAEVAAHARRYFPHAGLVFADLHAALAAAGTGDDDGLLSRIADCRAWPVMAACRRAKWHPLCARVRQLSAAATMPRLHRSSNLRYPISPGSAVVMRNARFSRTR
jgi:hypothetical protein